MKTKLVMNLTPKIGVEFKTNGVSILKPDFFAAGIIYKPRVQNFRYLDPPPPFMVTFTK